jgi:dynein heavy chain
MRSEFIRFLRLAYLLDFIVVQSLGTLYITNAKNFLANFTEKNSIKTMENLLGSVTNTDGVLIYKQASEPLFTIDMTL